MGACILHLLLQIASRNFKRAADERARHNVSGQVHTTATISNMEQTPDYWRVTFTPSDEKWMR